MVNVDGSRTTGRPTRLGLAAVVVLGVSVLSLVVTGCGGSDEEGGDEETTTTSKGPGSVLEVHPASGPPGTEIAWTWSDTACSALRDASAYLNIGTSEGESGKKTVAHTGPKEISGTTEELSGTLTVPTDAAPDSYTVSVDCFHVGGAVSGGQIGISAGFDDNADVGFEVTSD